MVIAAKKFEKVSFEQYMKDFMNLCDVEFLVEIGLLEYRMSGDYDSTAIATAVRKIYDSIKLPERGTTGSAGYDFITPFSFKIEFGKSITLPTGIKADINDGWWLLCAPRSGSGFKYGVELANTIGVIDKDYYNNPNNEGHIMVKLVNMSVINEDKDVVFEKDKGFFQGILTPYGVTENDAATGERNGGFGSTN